MVTPIFSSVFYASGSKDDPARQVKRAGGRCLPMASLFCARPHVKIASLAAVQAPTVLSEQWFNREEGCLEPETPAWSAMGVWKGALQMSGMHILRVSLHRLQPLRQPLTGTHAPPPNLPLGQCSLRQTSISCLTGARRTACWRRCRRSWRRRRAPPSWSTGAGAGAAAQACGAVPLLCFPDVSACNRAAHEPLACLGVPCTQVGAAATDRCARNGGGRAGGEAGGAKGRAAAGCGRQWGRQRQRWRRRGRWSGPAASAVCERGCAGAGGGRRAAGEPHWWSVSGAPSMPAALSMLRVQPRHAVHASRVRLHALLHAQTHATWPLPQVDELLEACGVRLTGAGAADAVVIRHPGLSLYPLDEEQVDPAHPLQVLAALLPTEEEESSSSSSEEE